MMMTTTTTTTVSITTSSLLLLLLSLSLSLSSFKVDAFMVVSPGPAARSTATTTTTTTTVPSFSFQLYAGGFGGSGSGVSKKKASSSSKETKLKPKQQWDRYLAMKGEEKYTVAVRSKNDENTSDTAAEGEPSSSSSEWLEVGKVKSKNGAYTAISVAKQRALIAEHAIRLYPLKASAKTPIEWAYMDPTSKEWIVVDKSILTENENEIPDGIEKLIGFEGTPDPSTGYYCIYDGGKGNIKNIS